MAQSERLTDGFTLTSGVSDDLVYILIFYFAIYAQGGKFSEQVSASNLFFHHHSRPLWPCPLYLPFQSISLLYSQRPFLSSGACGTKPSVSHWGGTTRHVTAIRAMDFYCSLSWEGNCPPCVSEMLSLSCRVKVRHVILLTTFLGNIPMTPHTVTLWCSWGIVCFSPTSIYSSCFSLCLSILGLLTFHHSPCSHFQLFFHLCKRK